MVKKYYKYMKLFLTATSERGKPITKSGNDWLHIDIIDEHRRAIASTHITYFKENNRATLNIDNFITDKHTTTTMAL